MSISRLINFGSDKLKLNEFVSLSRRGNVYLGNYSDGNKCVVKFKNKDDNSVIEHKARDVILHFKNDILHQKQPHSDIILYKTRVENNSQSHDNQDILPGEDEMMIQAVDFIAEYQVFNSNTGFSTQCNIADALSHYSWKYSRNEFVICDIKGCFNNDILTITNPCINSLQPLKYGPRDLGRYGLSLFFANHICNDLCKDLEKPKELSYVFFLSKEFIESEAARSTKQITTYWHDVPTETIVSEKDKIIENLRITQSEISQSTLRRNKYREGHLFNNGFSMGSIHHPDSQSPSPSGSFRNAQRAKILNQHTESQAQSPNGSFKTTKAPNQTPSPLLARQIRQADSQSRTSSLGERQSLDSITDENEIEPKSHEMNFSEPESLTTKL